ncbi:MAG: LAGLIDADG family homing endonuclease [Anaerolineales bacterium]|jgi:ribonucleoside-diphosphate reductase alpha chain|nr:LAGLIDADG family homing endonuclease [Anaerolineales bacterium]
MVANELSSQKHGLLPTPSLPADLPPVELTENARQVLVRRYVRRGDDGQPAETVEEMFWRVAYHVARVEEAWGGDVSARARHFYSLLTSKRFFPNSPTFTGAGTPLGQLAACFVLPISDDMGRDEAGIFQSLRNAALIQQTGGGNGFSFSRLRPAGGLVKSSAGQATGPVGFLRVYDHAFGEIAQGGTRRGANMGVLRVDHPDVEDFIVSKTSENAITNFNISVGITDAFMQAVQEDADWELVFPDISTPEYRSFRGTLEQARRQGLPIKVYKTIRARELFNKIVTQAHHNGEPGVLFLDAANRANPVPHLYPLESTNPCVTGETLIYTESGLRRADELAVEGQPLRVATDSRFGTETLMQATHVFQTGVKPVCRLLTREGYELRLTENHQVMTSRGWVEAAQLQPGDRVHLLDRAGGFGKSGTQQEGQVLGWLVGDGTVNAVRAVLSFFGEEKRELAPAFAQTVTDIVEKPGQPRAYPVGVVQIESRDEARVASDRLRAFAESHGLTENKFQVPASVFSGSQAMQRGFLQALFTADGQVNDGGEKGCSVRLSASHLTLLQDVQRLLLNFGIASKIYQNRRDAGYRLVPDGKGGSKEYYHQAQHELVVSKANLIPFANQIGFLAEIKNAKLADYLSRKTRGPYQETFLATVLVVEPDGVEAVFDLHQPETNSFIANGLVVHNCGEQWLGPFENCCLGSVNLAQHFGEAGCVNWETLRESVELSTRFLDDVIEANAYVPAVPQLKEAAHRARRIGLGIMGLADLMYHVGARYGSPEGQEFASVVMEFVRYHSMKTSIAMAEERGSFPAITGSIYDPADLKWRAPQAILPITQTWGRPSLDWQEITSGIKRHGIRNAAQTTVAPTGTIATVAGCEGYGCEPVFALAYIRHVNDHGKDLQLTYGSPAFEQALAQAGLDQEIRQAIFESVMEHGTCQNIGEVPEKIRNVFVTAGDVTAEEHVRMAGALQAFVDNSISKTINFHESASEDDVAMAYMLAWELGAKGITVYVTGSRDKVVLETKATLDKKQGVDSQAKPEAPERVLWHETKKMRPRALRGQTFNVNTPLGKAFITVNENGGDQPFEVFVNTSKAGSDTAAVSEAIGRLISYILRLASPIAPLDRMREIVSQLAGIGGGRSLGFGPNRVRSLPDGVGQVLDEYLSNKSDPNPESGSNGNGYHPAVSGPQPTPGHMKIGDLCPECGEAAVVNEEGCRKCYACGFSEC